MSVTENSFLLVLTITAIQIAPKLSTTFKMNSS